MTAVHRTGNPVIAIRVRCTCIRPGRDTQTVGAHFRRTAFGIGRTNQRMLAILRHNTLISGEGIAVIALRILGAGAIVKVLVTNIGRTRHRTY